MQAGEDWAEAVVDYWFKSLSPADWFQPNDAIDREISNRFSTLHARLAGEKTESLAADPKTALAAVIVLDQFSRNIFRRKAEAFAHDDKALAISRLAIAHGHDHEMSPDERVFLYMPFMHSEDVQDQEKSVSLFEKLGIEENLKYAREHRDIIVKFGRFPYRNRILGRESTSEEAEFTKGHSGYGQ